MAQAPRDQNRVPTLLCGVSSADGTTLIPITIDSVTGEVLIQVENSDAQGAVTNREIAYRDDNRVPVILGLSDDDGTTKVMPVCHPSGYLRIEEA